MRTTVTATLLGLLLATPVAAQAQNVQQLLGGLLTGNQGQDQALREAYQRGYQHGRDDQARQDRADRGRGDRNGYSDRGSDQGRRGYRDEQGTDNPRDPGYDNR